MDKLSSLEASLDEENKQVLAAMKNRSTSPNPKLVRGTTPPPPVRSMLNVGTTSLSDRLNPADPSTWTRPHRPSSPGPGRPSFDTTPIPQIHMQDQENHSPSRRRRSSNKSNNFSDASGTISEQAIDSSDEEGRNWSSDGESPEAERGRTKSKPKGMPNPLLYCFTTELSADNLAPQSKGVRSMVDPVSSPSRPAHHSTEVHPPSSFGRSGPNLSDFEQDPMEAEIQKAKSLGLSISPVDNSIPERAVRMIIRGEWAKLQDEMGENNHRSRLYLVCSDLSTEATYSLEWTIGTMLRDGDTLLAIYAIEDETAPKEAEGNREVMAESAKAAHDASETMATLTRQTTNLGSVPNFVPATEMNKLSGTTTDKKGVERLKAMDEVTENFLKLVRKTPLQVRCMVEVIHCKSPKHLILNAIDELEPTLCVVGTRGRSSLKGVLLGSFSNYLVTKSSVPVMVARKRLKKPKHAKVNSTNIRLSNNLTNSIMPRQRRSLTQARID